MLAPVTFPIWSDNALGWMSSEIRLLAEIEVSVPYCLIGFHDLEIIQHVKDD
jgi:hypothetical protein